MSPIYNQFLGLLISKIFKSFLVLVKDRGARGGGGWGRALVTILGGGTRHLFFLTLYNSKNIALPVPRSLLD